MMGNLRLTLFIVSGLLLLAAMFYVIFTGGINWSLLSVIMVSLSLLMFFIRFDRSGVSSRELALIATLSSLAAVSRVPFAVIMSVQPTTFMVMITGYVFGAQTGFVVGALAALVSNFFLGQGPWTPWQMFSWGLCGLLAAVLSKCSRQFSIVKFTLLCGLSGYIFGWIMNAWHWLSFVYPLTVETFAATYAASFFFDTLHAVGNVFFSLLLGKSFYLVLTRFKSKMHYRYDD